MARRAKTRAVKRRPAKTTRAAYPMARFFTADGSDPFARTAWERRTARIVDAEGRTVFEQRDVEVPAGWSQLATDLVASRYFAGIPGTKGRESSVQHVIRRIVRAIGGWVRKGRYLKSPKDVPVFEAELAHLLIRQMAAFNSPVWFNVGIDPRPQASACFIVGLADRLDAILDLAAIEGHIFSKGSGSGTNFSSLRSSKEPTRAGGRASGPLAFLRGLDALAGAVKSGGRTRRAAKMAILDVDHPDIVAFVRSKAEEERKARLLEPAGGASEAEFAPEASLGFQNENHSVRVPDAFMDAAGRGGRFDLRARTTGEVVETVDARGLMREIASAAHACGDPGLHFAGTVESWNPVPRTGPIRASNPCSEFMFLDDTACNLASLNVLAFRGGDGELDVKAIRAAVSVLMLAMDALVSNASYPTPAIARNSEHLRPLGLGLANVGALLMAHALPYDSDPGRNLAAGVMALVGGEATACSAQLAARRGAFAEWTKNRAPALRVLDRHRKAASALAPPPASPEVIAAAKDAWGRARTLAGRHGLRNAQVTCIAPTGTISFLMDCDTTGIEPELALVKEKKLSGGGRLRLVNRTVAEALERLGYPANRVREIVAHVERTGSIEGAPGFEGRHAAVFDTALPSAAGGRVIAPDAHLSMMEALQPFVSGAISKTVNLPADATVEDVERVYVSAWKRGLKAIAVYRDHSKVTQPLNASTAGGGASGKGHPTRCSDCGETMIPDGTCLRCPNCCASTGCA